MVITLFALLILALSVIGAALNLLAALFIRDGRAPLRLFAFVVCLAITGAYFAVIVWLTPNTIPAWIGRSLFAGALAVVCGWPFIDLWVWHKNK